MATTKTRLDTSPLDTLLAEVQQVPDTVDDLNMTDVRRDAAYKLTIAINSVKTLRKLSAE